MLFHAKFHLDWLTKCCDFDQPGKNRHNTMILIKCWKLGLQYHPFANHCQVWHAGVSPWLVYTVAKILSFWPIIETSGASVPTLFTNQGQLWHEKMDLKCILPCHISPWLTIYSHHCRMKTTNVTKTWYSLPVHRIWRLALAVPDVWLGPQNLKCVTRSWLLTGACSG